MKTLVDTSVLVGAVTVDPGLADDWVVSAITIGELEGGVLLAQDAATRAPRLRLLAAVLGSAPVLAIGGEVAARYGELRAATRRLPSNDLWIAATALTHGLTLVTADQGQAALPLITVTLV